VLSAQTIQVRLMPPGRAQFLQFQKFDVRVEASAPAGTSIDAIRVTLDGRDITNIGTVTGTGSSKAWTFRNMQLGISGERSLAATATSGVASGAILSKITV